MTQCSQRDSTFSNSYYRSGGWISLFYSFLVYWWLGYVSHSISYSSCCNIANCLRIYLSVSCWFLLFVLWRSSGLVSYLLWFVVFSYSLDCSMIIVVSGILYDLFRGAPLVSVTRQGVSLFSVRGATVVEGVLYGCTSTYWVLIPL